MDCSDCGKHLLFPAGSKEVTDRFLVTGVWWLNVGVCARFCVRVKNYIDSFWTCQSPQLFYQKDGDLLMYHVTI